MKQLLAIVAFAFATAAYAQGAKQPEGIIKAPEKQVEKKEEQNCVKKDKKGNCPPPPKSPKPTPKKKPDDKKS
jgi:hypothetical protein